MRYSRFEQLVLAVGTLAVLGTIVAAFMTRPIFEEIVAQLLLIVVLVGALHWGRNGGFVAALAAVLAYVLLRASTVAAEGLTPEIVRLVLLRMAVYGLVGILGGELSGRVKYILARLESDSNVDEPTHMYNERYFSHLLESEVASHTRYRSPFSLVLMELSPALFSELKDSKSRTMLRAVAGHIRNDLRLVDDVARLADGRFALLLPYTPKDGATVAANRVRQGVREMLGARDESVTVSVLSAPEDFARIGEFLDSIRPAGAGRYATEPAA